jgi:inward rectifier potassium channel
VLINAVDDKSSQAVHARSSYKWNEVVWGARFSDMYRHTRDGRMSIDLRRIHDIQEVDTPVTPNQTVWNL